MRQLLEDALERLGEGPLGGLLRGLEGGDPLRMLRAMLLFAFCLPALWSPGAWAAQLNWRLMVWIHEGGHGAFAFCHDWSQFGRFLTIAAGSGAQVLLPLFFVVAAWSVRQRFNAGLLMYLVGLNLVDVSRYAADARERAMPLIFNLGPESHDWGNMLLMTGLLGATPVIAGGIWLLGLVALVGGLALAILCSAD